MSSEPFFWTVVFIVIGIASLCVVVVAVCSRRKVTMTTVLAGSAVPTGWSLVAGPVRGGDKYWNAAEGKWYPITVNTFKDAAAYVAVIRKDGKE